VDSILIDEARTPLIISGASEESTDKYYKVNRIIPQLELGEEIQQSMEDKVLTGDYVVDEKHRTITVTDQGWERVEKLLGIGNIADPENWDLKHHVETAAKAHSLYRRDVEYVVKDGEVIIVDEFTGRLMPGRRWSDGLHQAVEAKENVKIERENQTLATVTFQNYFRMYKKLAGMTGTAETEAPEFDKIYKLEVVVIPTNRELRRIENPDVVYRTEREKYNAVAGEIQQLAETGQPVLVGTTSVEKSERLSDMLKKKGVRHVVLNAKYQVPTAQWQEINAKYKEQTDAEHEEVIGSGGLFILGTERHEARRIDNQLRGRAGRQGDPGASRFYLSLEDDLMRIFAKEWVSNLLQRLGMEEGIPIESGLITRRIEAAQKAVEAQNFEARKHVLEYDDVMNKQRQAVYGLRRQLLEGLDQKELILEDYVRDILGGMLDKFCGREVHPEDWDLKGLKNQVFTQFGVDIDAEGIDGTKLNRQELGDAIFEKLTQRYDAKEQLIGPDAMRHHERIIMLSVLDQQWKDHLLSMDHLREGIGLRGYGQHDPLVEYKRESFDMFEAMMERFEEETVRYLYLMQIIERREDGTYSSGGPIDGGTLGGPRSRVPAGTGGGNGGPRPRSRAVTSMDDMEAAFQRRKKRELEAARMAGAGAQEAVQQVVRGDKVGRNDPCPCGSGKKYKKCCGA